MPELPEVETVRRGLAHLITGYTITSGQDLHPRVLKMSSIAPLASLPGARIKAINRRSKFLWFILDRPEVLVAHLGMSGQFLINRPNRPTPKHICATFELNRGLHSRNLYFNDQRTFGWLSVERLVDGVAQSRDHFPSMAKKASRALNAIVQFTELYLRIGHHIFAQDVRCAFSRIYSSCVMIHSMLMFVPMTASEFDSWLPSSFAGYRTEIIASGEEEVAADQNLRQTRQGLFPDDKPASGQYFMKILDQDISVGMLWLRAPQIEGSGAWYIYQIEIDEKFRGNGYGRQTMQELEDWVRARGGSRLVLNVFGQNVVAQSLYDSLGFTTQAKRMFKEL